MSQKIIVTNIGGRIITALSEDDRIVELHYGGRYEDEEALRLGNIYIGKVQNIVQNIRAAFIEVAGGISCYYPMDEGCMPIFTSKFGKKPLCIGDELLVQISKEAVKTKAPSVSAKLNFTGKYAVLTYGDTRIGLSSKLTRSQKDRLRKIAGEYQSEEYGFIIRTNAAEVSDEILRGELEFLIEEYEYVRRIGASRVCYSCVKQAPAPYLTDLKNAYQKDLTAICVEDERLYQNVEEYLRRYQPEDLPKLVRYEDKLLPMHKLYSIEKHLTDALKERVWLKSGAYLVIQPTEAMTVIDVNTGKCVSKKKDDETFLKINLEAATEVARQLRLRNLSGIILIDFINMNDAAATQELLKKLEKELKKDPIETILVDMTKLQFVEITRKKIRKPLKEALENTHDSQEEIK